MMMMLAPTIIAVMILDALNLSQTVMTVMLAQKTIVTVSLDVRTHLLTATLVIFVLITPAMLY
jgi:hypothetical protein